MPRPGLVTAGCLLLYGAATAQPVVFALYYTLSFATLVAADIVLVAAAVGGAACRSGSWAARAAARSRRTIADRA
jgi:hypothetical protein